MGINIYLFDIDGTLISTGGAGINAMNAAFRDLIGSSSALGDLDFSGQVDHDILCKVYRSKRSRAPSKMELGFLKTSYLRYLEVEIKRSSRFRIMPGIRDWLASLNNNPKAVVGLATGNFCDGAWIKLKYAGLSKYFSFGSFGDDEHERTKLIKKAIMMGRTRCGDKNAKVFVIGDSKNDIICGRAAGAITVAVATGRASEDDLSGYAPDFLFKDLSDYGKVEKDINGAG